MTLKDWLEISGVTVMSLSKMSGFSRNTIRNLCKGNPARYRTIKRLIRVTSKMKVPIAMDMFPKIISRKRFLPK